MSVVGSTVGGVDLTVSETLLTEADFAVFDLETTGWSPEQADITEIGAVRMRGSARHGEFASLVSSSAPVPLCIEELTGISDWLLASAPRISAVLPGFLRFAEGCLLVAHNALFDLQFLRAACADCGLGWPDFIVLDTVALARCLLGDDEVPDHKLGTLAAHFRTRIAPSHRALADSRATAEILSLLLDRLAARGIRTLAELAELPDVIVAPVADTAPVDGERDENGTGASTATHRDGASQDDVAA